MTRRDFRETLKGQLKAARLFQEYEMDFRTWEILLLIATDEGEGAVALAKKHDISKSAFSRHVLFLCGERAKRGNQKDAPDPKVHKLPGRLVEKRTDPKDIRRHSLYLTREGHSFIDQVQKLIAG